MYPEQYSGADSVVGVGSVHPSRCAQVYTLELILRFFAYGLKCLDNPWVRCAPIVESRVFGFSDAYLKTRERRFEFRAESWRSGFESLSVVTGHCPRGE